VTEKKPGQKPGSMHIDKRAGRLLKDPVSDGPDDDLLTTQQVAEWLTYSTQKLEIMRGRDKGPNMGPRFVRLSPRKVMYRRDAVREWLRKREVQSTAQYRKKP